MSVIDGFDLNNFNFMEWDYLAIYEVKVDNQGGNVSLYRISHFSGYFPTREQRDRVDPELLAHCHQLHWISPSHSLLCGEKMLFNYVVVSLTFNNYISAEATSQVCRTRLCRIGEE